MMRHVGKLQAVFIGICLLRGRSIEMVGPVETIGRLELHFITRCRICGIKIETSLCTGLLLFTLELESYASHLAVRNAFCRFHFRCVHSVPILVLARFIWFVAHKSFVSWFLYVARSFLYLASAIK